MSSGVALAARAIISRTAGSWRSISSRSPSDSVRTCSSSASSISVESNSPPRLSGAIRGWSGRTMAAPRTTSSASVARTGKVLTERHGRSSGDTNRPPVTRSTGWVEISERLSAPARSRPGGDQREVVHPQDGPRTRPRSAAGSVSSAMPSVRPPTETSLPAARPASAPAIAPERSTRWAAAWWRSPEAARNRTSARRTASAGAPDEAAKLEVVKRARHRRRVDRGIDDAKGGGGGVLGRAGGVRVQRVALPQQGLQRAPPAAQPSRRLPSSAVTVSSRVGRPRASLARWSAWRVSERSPTHAVPG